MMHERRAGPVVLSPHLDDAVLSAWHALTASGDAQVVTVYAGVPEPGFVTDLDRSHGASDSAAWLRRRRRDDEAALRPAGARPTHLDLLEVQFPAYRIPQLRDEIAADPGRFLQVVADEPRLRTDPGAIVDLLRPVVPPGAVVYAPVGVGGHPDHRDLAEAATLLAAQGWDVRRYADSPYYLMHGPPSWISGGPNDAADRWVGHALAGWTGPGRGVRREVVSLSPQQLHDKEQAMRRYTTEYPNVMADLTDRGLDPQLMRYEVYWTPVGAASSG